MRQRTFFSIIILSALASVCSAGTIAKGIWSPSACGAEPVAPQINQTTVDNYNKSVTTINAWQEKVATYNACVIKEANDDNASIVKSATERQAKLKMLTDKVQADTAAAKALLDKPKPATK
jgi:hypothetical protein